MSVLDGHRIIPVVVVKDPKTAVPLAEAMAAGGLPIAEVTFRTPAAVDAIRAMAGIPEMLVGAGTVVTAEQVDIAADAGAVFVVSPGLNADVVRRARERQLTVLPGAVTPSEIMAALALGVNTCKFFPASSFGGVGTVSALAHPFPSMSFVPTGGIGPADVGRYLELPNVAAIGGSWMVPSAVIADGDYATITRLCREAMDLVKASTRVGCNA
jgi:Entner-Doudoroff aldolase